MVDGTIKFVNFINPRATDVDSAHHVLLCAVDRVQRLHKLYSPIVFSSVRESPCAADLRGSRTSAAHGLAELYVLVVLGLRGVAEEHLLTLAELLARPLRPHAVSTVARASLEASAQLAWLQAPELDTRGRLARLGSAMLGSAHELCKAGDASATVASVSWPTGSRQRLRTPRSTRCWGSTSATTARISSPARVPEG